MVSSESAPSTIRGLSDAALDVVVVLSFFGCPALMYAIWLACVLCTLNLDDVWLLCK